MQAGWFPDPVGDHEFRYHNGSEWTGDVATDGERGVSPIPTRRPDRRSGALAMVFGIISLSTGWIPFVSFVAAVFGIVAVVVGWRRRGVESARGAATVGIVTGVCGILLSGVGIWLSVVIVRSIADFEDPGPHEVELTECVDVDGTTRVTGAITNLDDRERSYTVVVSLDEDTTVDAVVSDVPGGERRVFQAVEELRFDDLDCSVLEVNGPRPFGMAQS
ncbi:MAG: DUF2510 domain-containing protein [Ilumatobacter sp.]|uniref:DUF2510 domain-containing protein n=1 Tax=Ilumatobacter sp. TaxID=1967498 RepID=UPI003299DAB4